MREETEEGQMIKWGYQCRIWKNCLEFIRPWPSTPIFPCSLISFFTLFPKHLQYSFPSFHHLWIPFCLFNFLERILSVFPPLFCLSSILPFFLGPFLPPHPLHLPSFLSSFLPSILPTFLPSFFLSFLPSFYPSFFFLSFLPSFYPSFLLSKIKVIDYLGLLSSHWSLLCAIQLPLIRWGKDHPSSN